MFDLSVISPILLWTAIAIYAASFVAFAVDLAHRSQATADAKTERAAEPVGAGVGGRSASSSTIGVTDEPAQRRFVMARIGTSLMTLAWVFHLAATVTRGIDAGRVPWANLYEFAMLGTLLIVAVFLVVLTRIDLRYLGTFITGLVVILLGLSTTNFYVEVTPLMDPLKSIWLIIHVFVASLGTAFFALSFALSVTQLMQSRRERLLREGSTKTGPRFLSTFPSAERLESLSYRFAIIGFILWTFTLIAGSIWAYYAWSRYWGFDVKETWTFVIWVIYAGYIHARATRGWRGNPSAWLSIVGFAAVMFNFTIVNVFFKGLHAYSGLS
ncbi:c-type cytochrome biogenesis protein CcsB [Microbacterium sp. NPDC057944]|uniref:c-type cytochrome biogenesis protein CcsB n=1 Tax=Microbacterium sp. NPDC057944 TaxID=3346286 RepID=UPI0036DD9873